MGAGMAALFAVSTPSTRRGTFSGSRVLFATVAGVAVGAYIALEFFPSQPLLQVAPPQAHSARPPFGLLHNEAEEGFCICCGSWRNEEIRTRFEQIVATHNRRAVCCRDASCG